MVDQEQSRIARRTFVRLCRWPEVGWRWQARGHAGRHRAGRSPGQRPGRSPKQRRRRQMRRHSSCITKSTERGRRSCLPTGPVART